MTDNEKFFKLYFSGLTSDKIEDFYAKKLQDYLYRKSNVCLINGENEPDIIHRILMKLPNKDGNPNIKSCSIDGKSGDRGFDIEEIDFIESEIEMLNKRAKSANLLNNLDLKHCFKYFMKFLQERLKSITFEAVQSNETKETIDREKNTLVRPTINPNAANAVYEILKDFFDEECHIDVENVIKKLQNSSKKLLFKGNCNQLANVFKQLKENNLITGWEKKDIEQWLINNFNYLHRKKVKQILSKTINNIISTDTYPCKNPLILIKNGQVFRVEDK